jgi:hypothetical protein
MLAIKRAIFSPMAEKKLEKIRSMVCSVPERSEPTIYKFTNWPLTLKAVCCIITTNKVVIKSNSIVAKMLENNETIFL